MEAAALDRLVQGGFVSRGPLEDALLVAVVETGVPVWALDDARLDGPAGAARRARRASAWGRASTRPTWRPGAWWWPTPRARWRCSSATSRPAARPDRDSARLRLFAVAVPGVPALHVEEALFGCADALSDARGAQ